jgi:hypothetical protein
LNDDQICILLKFSKIQICASHKPVWGDLAGTHRENLFCPAVAMILLFGKPSVSWPEAVIRFKKPFF